MNSRSGKLLILQFFFEFLFKRIRLLVHSLANIRGTAFDGNFRRAIGPDTHLGP
jgi:hypothetical protein